MIIKAIRDYFKKCPLLKSGKINVNYLGEEPIRYTIDAVPAAPIIKQYVDGGSQRQYVFVFASRDYYSPNVLENLETQTFYDEFAAWIEAQNDARNYPVLPDEKYEALAVQVLTSGYAFDATTRNARFQIQCRLVYKKER